MEVCILMGSPRKNGNTQALVAPFVAELEKNGHNCTTLWLYDKDIRPCLACRNCQHNWEAFGCPIDDDMQAIFETIMNSQLIVLATPIYSWFCTPPMKSAIDRLVYGMNKYFGDKRGPSLWKGKNLALIATCGYPLEQGVDLWEDGIKRFCKHSKLNYLGMLAQRDMGYNEQFMNPQREEKAKLFALELI